MGQATKQRLLITGGSGFLGSDIARSTIKGFKVYATYYTTPVQIAGCSFVPLDIRNREQTFSSLKEIKPDLVIHTAALVDVDYCEEHSEEAWSINTEGTENVALATREVGAKLVYISTDSVFDGEKGMYGEEDVPHPLNVYARTKLEGEARVRCCLPESIIIRTAFYGWGFPGKHSLADWLITQLKRGEKPKMFTEVLFSPIPINVLVAAMLEMCGKNLSGLYHVGGRERCSKYTFGLELARAFGFNESCIQPSTRAEAQLKAPRPKDISLNVNKTLSSGIYLPSLREGISWLLKEKPLR